MPVPTDPFNFTNGTTADADQVDARFLPLYTALAAALDETNLSAALKERLGVSDASTVRRGVATVATGQSRASNGIGDLATMGPTVTVEVPADGIVEVLAQVTVATPTGFMQIHLYEDGTDLGPIISQSVAGTYYTSSQGPGVVGGVAEGSAGTNDRSAAHWLAFPATAGSHAYKMRYWDDSPHGWVFSNRKIWVRTADF